MFKRLIVLLIGILVLLGTKTSSAQHDVHRNAVQGIARDDLKWADHQIGKARANDPETHYVRMMIALKRGDVSAAAECARRALDLGLPFARLVAGPRDLLAPLRDTAWFASLADKRGDLKLLHGPMVGAVTGSSASVWVRTAQASEVQVIAGDRRSDVVRSSSESDFTAVCVLQRLKPNTTYDYRVLVDGEEVSAENTTLTTFPEPGRPANFSVAFGGGAGYMPESERMWDTIGTRQPLALFMLGDNVYIDQPKHALCQRYCYYRRQTRPEWRRLVASTSTFAIYDDHDFGTNDCVPGSKIESPPWKRSVWEIFKQNWVNPSYGGGQSQPGCWFDFHIGDVHFMMIDGRYYRDLEEGSMLGPVQKEWLFETLKTSRATFKVLASPVPWSPGVKPGSNDPWDGYPEEREEIFSFIEAEKIEGVFLIAADRHRTDLRKTARQNGYDLYEFESSRLTNRHNHKVIQTPGLIWGYNETCSFGLMRFDTTMSDPKVTFECVSIDGDVIHDYQLPVRKLTYR